MSTCNFTKNQLKFKNRLSFLNRVIDSTESAFFNLYTSKPQAI